jgi:hypothetical protein
MGKIELPGFGEQWEESRETGRPQGAQLKFSLSDAAGDWHYFNHGAFFAFAEFDYPQQDPVADWYARQPVGTQLLMQPFKMDVFEGIDAPTYLGNLTWNNVICGVNHELWQSLFEYVGGVCSINDKTKQFYRAFSGDVKVLDPVLVEQHSALALDLPTIDVTVFCVDGNTARWEIRPPLSPIGPPRMVKTLPRAEVVQMADSVFAGDVKVLAEHDNPAMQKHLDKFKAAQQQGPIILEP